MQIMIILLILTLLASLWAAMTPLLLRAALGLALASALLSVIMFQLSSPYAAVFELSVCAGLISVIFISVITLTHRLPLQEYLRRRQSRIYRFMYLPFIVLAVIGAMMFVKMTINIVPSATQSMNDVRVALWEYRRIYLFGQIMAILAGVFGVIVLFKGDREDDR